MLEIQMLRMLTQRDDWQRIKDAIPGSGLAEKTKQLAGRFTQYYEEFPEVTAIVADEFFTWYFGTVNTKANDEQKAEWYATLDNILRPVEDGVKEKMFAKLLEVQAASELGTTLIRYEEGEDIDIAAEAKRIISNMETNRRSTLEDSAVSYDVLDMLDAEESGIGLRFNTIPILNEFIKPVTPGNLFVVAARPDAGKTTLVEQITYGFAPDMVTVFGPGRGCTWLCNEGDPRKIMFRMYNVVFGMSNTELREFKRTVCKGSNTIFLDKFWEKWGQVNAFTVLKANDKTSTWVEDEIAKRNPGVVVYDMLDNIRFSGKTLHLGTRTDQVLESMYQWGRNLAVDAGHVAIATSQTSGDAEGIPFPAKSQLKDSKTGKQGASDVIIIMGESADPSMERYRYLGTPKNKLAKDDRPKNAKITTIFDHTRGSFTSGGAAPADVVAKSDRKVTQALEANDETVNTEAHSGPESDQPVKPQRKSRKQAPIDLEKDE